MREQLIDDVLIPIIVAIAFYVCMKGMVVLNWFLSDNPTIWITALAVVIAWRVFQTLVLRDDK